MARLAVSKCPYYKRERKLSITCEGLIDGTFMQIRFPDPEFRLRHQRCYCRNVKHWSMCPYAKVLDLKHAAAASRKGDTT